MEPEVHYCIHKHPPPVLFHSTALNASLSNFFRAILILSSHLELGFSSGLFHSDLPTKTSFVSKMSHIPCPSHSPWFDYQHNIWWGVRSQSFKLCSLLNSSATSSLLGPNIFLSTLLWNTLSLFFSLSVRDQASHPYKTGKIIVLHIFIFILIFWIVNSKKEDSALNDSEHSSTSVCS